MKITLLSLMLILVLSCKGNSAANHNRVDEKSEQSDTVDFFQDEYGIVDTLYMDVVLADCGEWGGPREEYKIYEAEKEYRLEYKRHKYVCDSLEKYYGKEPVMDKKQSLNLTKADTRLISDFFIELMNEKIGKNPLTSHAGNIFVLYDRDSTLFLSSYTDLKRTEVKYSGLRNKLGLSK
jgi:hypothetical protein